MQEKILVVDDEKDICNILQFNLENEGFEVEVAHSGEEALRKLSDSYSLIILDVMMEGMSGFKMAEKVRREGNTVPIIFLTAKNAENDMLKGFSLGGDDYITKPFSVKEVLARVKAVLKRTTMTQTTSTKWVHEDLAIDMSSNRVTIKDEEVPLTRKEFEILVLLAQSAPTILTRSDILNKVWSDNEFVLDRTVDVHITRLRKKLGNYASLIQNRSGFGYYLNTDLKIEK
ncbi:MAG: response regulator transcription factor [Dysgonamonadaceae bacterium]|nr:response regulator transcription factor [Dysgonamonadaceae bacterium]MDD4379810.1 response regulator transcription factor [Dysgonamonadaceae bacterium]NLH29227.1 response regulator transcription factor [Bacteroidales bacterium]HXL00750.1 response regulator transcription factor [Dysgonamonadaceae bacterium]